MKNPRFDEIEYALYEFIFSLCPETQIEFDEIHEEISQRVERAFADYQDDFPECNQG